MAVMLTLLVVFGALYTYTTPAGECHVLDNLKLASSCTSPSLQGQL